MNLALVDPFVLAQDIPEALIARLRSSGTAVCLRFSRQGDLLASGTAKGAIVIFDLETNGVARKLRGHTPGRQVQSLSWSSTGRYLFSSSVDWKGILWDLQDGSRIRTVNFGAPVFIAELHPSNHLLCAAALYEDQPVLADLTTHVAVKRTLPTLPKRSSYDQDANSEKQAAQDAKNVTSVVLFTPSGHHIITGTTKGWLNIIHAKSCNVIYSVRLSNKALLLMRLTATGRDLLVNAADSIVRTIKLPDLTHPNFDPDNIRLEVEHKFQDVVNRLSWNHVAFSSTGDYVMASTLMNHDIYIWERGHGSLVKILEGPKEELGAVEVIEHCCIPAFDFKDKLTSFPTSGILNDLLSRPSASSLAASTFGLSTPRSAGPPWRQTLSKWKKTWNTLSARMNLTFTQSRRFTSAGWISRTRTLTF